ncbi:MAG: site-specific DNA-methyltransferase [Firmicutes bacterium]|nr:site-specific DNA-methyltransferase [Bacillota bacterium]
MKVKEVPSVAKSTSTRSFGASKRENHDSTGFYNCRLYNQLQEVVLDDLSEQPLPEFCIDRVFCRDARSLSELPNNSVHMMVTSPPYNVGKEYDGDLSLDEYRGLLQAVFAEVFRVLIPGGRACVNVANIGRRPYIPLHAYIITDMLDIGFRMRGEIIWNKAASAGGSTAWGSWLSASNPTLRDVHEYILVFSKGSFGRNKQGKVSTIDRDEFLEYTRSVWEFPADSARKIGHPAPFPVELPYRLIQLYTFVGEVVLDPFCGSGSTCIAALKSGRHYIGYEIAEEYVELSEKRIADYHYEQERARLEAELGASS